MEKLKVWFILFASVIFLFGCYLVYNNQILLGIILMMWGNNISMHLKKD